jgi:hypothetical protein
LQKTRGVGYIIIASWVSVRAAPSLRLTPSCPSPWTRRIQPGSLLNKALTNWTFPCLNPRSPEDSR